MRRRRPHHHRTSRRPCPHLVAFCAESAGRTRSRMRVPNPSASPRPHPRGTCASINRRKRPQVTSCSPSHHPQQREAYTPSAPAETSCHHLLLGGSLGFRDGGVRDFAAPRSCCSHSSSSQEVMSLHSWHFATESIASANHLSQTSHSAH